MRRIIAALCVASLTTSVSAQTPAAVQAPEIVVSGRGTAQVPADRAVIHVHVKTQAKNGAEAAARKADKVAAIEARVRQVGGGAVVSTAGYAVEPIYRYTEERVQVFSGSYVASHALRVEVPELSGIGSLIDAILEAGATQIVGTSFEAENLDEARATAIRAAVAQAHRDATLMAEAAGGQLGELVLLTTEPERTGIPGVRLEALQITGPTQITPSNQVIYATVVGRWRFKPRQ
jgi:uncharacterized protein YggE